MAETPIDEAAIAALAQHLHQVATRPEARGLHGEITETERARLMDLGLSDQPSSFEDLARVLTDKVMPNSMTMAHPRFFGFIPTAPSNAAWLFDALVSAYNPFCGSWLQSSGPTTIEMATIDLLRKQVGMPDTAFGVFLSGGSIANMTGLAAARATKLSQDQWSDGIAYVTGEAHSSIVKGLQFIGVPRRNIRKIATDADGRMLVDELQKTVRADRAAGLRPFAVAATFGTTNIGAIDPIEEIAAVCAEEDIWLHVDGAYGASLSFSKTHGETARCLGLADSLSWDPHKWMFLTYVCSCLIVKDRNSLQQSFSSRADYLRDAGDEMLKPNFWDFGPEMTRPARAVRLWATMQHLGREALGRSIDHTVQLAEVAARRIEEMAHWRVTSSPRMSIVTFRFEPEGLTEDQIDQLNADISKQVFEDGYAAVLSTRLKGKTVLRLCSTNPKTTHEDILSTLKKLDEAGQVLMRTGAVQPLLSA